MLFGPIFSVELITSARRTRYLAARIIYALILLFILWMMYAESARHLQDARELAKVVTAFFMTFAFVQLVAVLLLTPAMVAGTVSQEHERRTLDYLLASQLSNSEIVLGKLSARLLHVAFVLLTGVPILFLVSMLGGIPPRQIVLSAVVTLSTLVATGAMSIAISVWTKRTRDAVVKAYIMLLALLTIPPLTWALLNWQRNNSFLDWIASRAGELTELNPFWITGRLSYAYVAGTQMTLWDACWPILASYGGFSLVCIVAAVTNVRRVYLRSAGKGNVRRRFNVNLRLWRPSLGDRPMIWKELFAERAMMRLGWLGNIALGLLLLAIVVGTISMYITTNLAGMPSDPFIGYAIFMGTTVACAGLLLCAARAATSITAEKERDCWVSLISTPLENRAIVSGKIWGNLYALRLLALPLAFIWGLAVVREPRFLGALPWLIVPLGVQAVFCSCLGMRFSLGCRNSTRALAGAIATLLIIGGGYLLCCMTGLMISTPGGPRDNAWMVILAPCIPFLLGAPGALWLESIHGRFSPDDGAATFACVLGTVGYLIATIALWANCVADFDRLNDRPVEEK